MTDYQKDFWLDNGTRRVHLKGGIKISQDVDYETGNLEKPEVDGGSFWCSFPHSINDNYAAIEKHAAALLEAIKIAQLWDKDTGRDPERVRNGLPDIVEQWDCFVMDVLPEVFTARLTPTVTEGPDLDAEIYINRLDEVSKSRLRQGAIFTLTAFSDKSKSLFEFSEPRQWTKEEIADAEKFGKEWANLFEQDDK